VIGRLSDAFQLAWGLFYWNLRKTWFRLRHGHVPCPCQSPSDSGRAMETRCEPSLTLQRPARFRHVCPLLRPDAEGRWRCSVDTPDVRPFWGRALVLIGLALVCIYGVGTLGAWGLLRWRGYPLSYFAVAWPPAWTQFHLAQSRFFVAKANRALARNDIEEALMSLSVAYQKDPQNYPLGRLFARLAQAGQPALADRVYSQLAHDHPAQRAETYAAWYEALLWRADFKSITALAKEALALDPNRGSAWLNALIFALRREPDRQLVRELASSPTSPDARTVFSLELQTLESPVSAKSALLKPMAQNASAYLAFYRPKRLIELGFAQDALGLLGRNNPLPGRDQLVLRFEAQTALGWKTLIRGEVESLLANPLNPTTAELLIGYLIRHPDAELLALTFDAFKQQPQGKDEGTYRLWAGWLCAAGACGDFERFHQAGAQMKAISGAEFRALKQVEGFFRGDNPSTRIEGYLPAMQPIPLEVTYALLERYYRSRAPAKTLP